MHLTPTIKKILSYYSSDNPGVRSNLAKLLMSGNLGGTGKMIILPVDQGFEHGPQRSFISNPSSYDPQYHIEIAIKAKLSAYAAPLGMLEAVAADYPYSIPTILKVNSSNSLVINDSDPDQTITAGVSDALRLGCSAVGLTIYPGSKYCKDMIEEAKEVIAKAKEVGLPTIVWSYPRGRGLSKGDETAIDVVSYATHIAALIGAHIIKVKLPENKVYSEDIAEKYKKYSIDFTSLEERVAHVVQSAFNGKRLVIFSGGASKNLESLYDEVKSIRLGGGNGSIIGRNVFQRHENEAISMLEKITNLYLQA